MRVISQCGTIDLPYEQVVITRHDKSIYLMEHLTGDVEIAKYSTEEKAKKAMEDNIYNFCKDGKCSQCGNCCSNLLPMSRKEVDAIHRYIRKNHIKECKHLLPTANRPYDMTCPFLDTDKSCEKCRIYPVRPEICKQFICDNEQRAKHNRALLGQTRQIVDVRSEFYDR